MRSFRRIVSSGKFIPEIDGLRFFAIASVLIHHLTTFIHFKDMHVYTDQTNYNLLKDFGWKGFFGVHLFFVISGFVLALPFARMHFKLAEPVNIKGYLLRRLTRLEPPYFIVMTILLFSSVYITRKLELSEALQSYFSSILYIHNFTYDKGTHPLLNVVAWSLEIEIQFYLLAPLLSYYFVIKNVASRRVILCTSIVIFTLASPWIPLPFISLLNFIQYFLTGFLLADFYLTKPAETPGRHFISELFAIFCLACIWLFNARAITSEIIAASWQLLQLILVFGFYYLVLVKGRCAWIRANVLVTVGGMCYTIYLIHYPLISLFGNFLINIQFSPYSYVNITLVVILLLFLIMFCSALFFVWIERPCMNKNWPHKLLTRIRSFN